MGPVAAEDLLGIAEGGPDSLQAAIQPWRPHLRTPMTRQPEKRSTQAGASAGIYLLSAVLLCAAIGSGVGALAGSLLAGVLVGTMAGFVTGIALVIVRFRDL